MRGTLTERLEAACMSFTHFVLLMFEPTKRLRMIASSRSQRFVSASDRWRGLFGMIWGEA